MAGNTRKAQRELEWGQTPWDEMTWPELRREVQRLYSALESARGIMGQHRFAREHSPFWGPEGVGGRAWEKAQQALAVPFTSESLYRSFYRYADDLLFEDRNGVQIGFGWVICPKCGTMRGVDARRDKLIGTPCEHGVPDCTGEVRALQWSDLQPKQS